MSVHTLSSIRLPADGFQRDAPTHCIVKQPSFWERYDSQTLVYDAYHCAKRKTVRLLLPRTFNFAAVLKTATFTIDGELCKKPKWRKWRHHETLTFHKLATAKVLTVEIGSHTFTVPINAIDQGLAGLNTIYTLSRDNDLNWLRDWARFHVEHHNLQAIVLFDNGSTAYDLAKID
jgi:hypothetical protein